jgi:GDPmannose 4,6-dehydratase
VLFNHESPLRPARFVTRKIVQAACRIAAGTQREKLELGNLGIHRDWGWAPEYVQAMWKMLQRDVPEDFVVATGEANSLADFVEAVFQAVGLDAQDWTSSNERLFRPTDIRYSCGLAQKARDLLGWQATKRMHGVAQAMVTAERQGPA